mmetsp:Transcript_57708/g.137300  ORF Transcript_57708/g.137300 Transcript_57708/m.137300 type:complete len:793 (+) Transcript_57708:261-2639(+)|eukprot:CAMPEP_0178384654 /NCGR_PEP_ID=MMETSP0689_2-20121128/7627_1 /TAXON_ID=160604 /ORGANISM="Amphidinium massartii, Strain CS-259" /LENGTH=792 /DNA_ID=CAMNT_0020004909 /DNA_START=173 /DNA_END=2551 /DNA_ORIENTATION=-
MTTRSSSQSGYGSHQTAYGSAASANSLAGSTASLGVLPSKSVANIPSARTPWFVPAVQPIELFFFQRVFQHLCAKKYKRLAALAGTEEQDIDMKDLRYSLDQEEVPLVEFQIAMVRLLRVLHVLEDPEAFKISDYDVHKNGSVGWLEFCSLWNTREVVMQLSLAERIFITLEDSERSMSGRCISVLVFLAIVVSLTSFILSTLPDFHESCDRHDTKCRPTTLQIFKDIDLVCVIFFCIEYGMRLFLSAFVRMELADREKKQLLEWMISDEPMRIPTPLQRLFFYFINPANLVDLAAILPWFLTKATEESDGENNVVIRLIRLTRVVRAIRLGKHFEAVIIIARTLKKSLRALQVLTLNLVLGMIVFGSLMYFAEQGEWRKDQQAFVRWESMVWNPDTEQWDDVYNRSPFNSIPSCFWWAIVTASTVGYGDTHTPTTVGGKAVSAAAMLWSLCVLALPIGVVGNNFSQVWEEYDKERKEAEIDRKHEETMLKKSLLFGDPLHFSQQMRLEVWHDCGLGPEQHSEFLGKVECRLELPPEAAVKRVCEGLRLEPDYEKGQRRVSGRVSFEYVWSPLPKETPDTLLRGTLEVLVLGADGLIGIDWKGSYSSDPYCTVIVHPKSPKANLDGVTEPTVRRTKAMADTSFPKWNESFRFDMHWTHSGSASALINTMRNSAVLQEKHQPETRRRLKPSSCEVARSTNDLVTRVVPQLQAEVAYLKGVRPQLCNEIADLRSDLQLILRTLRARDGSPPCEGHQLKGDARGYDSSQQERSVADGNWAEPKQPQTCFESRSPD